jgi:hypothetical protein
MSDDSTSPHVHVPPSTAWHAAGHVVAAFFLGRYFDSVTVGDTDAEQGALGHCRFERFADDFAPDVDSVGDGAGDDALERVIRPKILELYAGHVAEKRYMGRNNNVGSQHDRDMARQLAAHYVSNDDELAAYLQWLWVRTEAAVASPMWQRAIWAVACALLDRRMLTYVEARAMIDAVTRTATRQPPKE